MGGKKTWKRVEAEWRDVVLVCRKCSKKLGGGFGPDGDETLSKALRRALDEGSPRKVKAMRRQVGIVDVACLDVCPRHAVVAVKGSEPGRLMLVPEGADMDDVMDGLGLRRGAPP